MAGCGKLWVNMVWSEDVGQCKNRGRSHLGGIEQDEEVGAEIGQQYACPTSASTSYCSCVTRNVTKGGREGQNGNNMGSNKINIT